MTLVDESRKRCLCRVVPLAGSRFAPGILRRRNDLEVCAPEFFVKFLPAWQIESAPSPGGPGDEEHFLAAELRQLYETAGAIGDREIRRET